MDPAGPGTGPGRVGKPRDPVGTEFGFALPVLDEPEAIDSLE